MGWDGMGWQGMSENWAVFPLQPWFLDFKLMVLDNTVVTKSMVEVNQPNATIYLVPYSHVTHYKSKWRMQHLDSRCVLLSDPTTSGARGPNQNTSRIQHKEG